MKEIVERLKKISNKHIQTSFTFDHDIEDYSGPASAGFTRIYRGNSEIAKINNEKLCPKQNIINFREVLEKAHNFDINIKI